MTEKSGTALRKFKLATGRGRSRSIAKGDDVTLPANQFDDFALAGLVGPKRKSKKPAKTADTANPGETPAKGADK